MNGAAQGRNEPALKSAGYQVRFAKFFTPMRRFTVLLMALLFMMTGQAVLTGRVEDFVGAILLTLVMLAALGAVADTRKRIAVAVSLSIPGCLLLIATTVSRQPAIVAASSVVIVVFLGFAAAAILQYVFRARLVDRSVILASVCVYLIMAVLWAQAYGLMELLHPGSLAFPPVDASGTRAVMQYFSFITITSTGYGDILPVTPLARATAATEALVGQLYLVVLVSRLVGLYTSQEAKEKVREVLGPVFGPDSLNGHECAILVQRSKRSEGPSQAVAPLFIAAIANNLGKCPVL